MNQPKRLVILDVLTLIATILVVMGHHKFLRGDIEWYSIYDEIIYSFHMGFFMTISGFLIKYTYHDNYRWGEFVGKKIKKFAPAYFAVGILAALLSFNSLEHFVHDMLMLFVNPCNGPIQIIWYIYVLLMYYCLAPFIFRLSTKQQYVLLVISIIPAIFYNHIPSYFNLNNFFRLLPFFLLGSLFAEKHQSIQKIADWTILLLSIPFLLFLASCVLSHCNPLKGGIGKLIPSILSLPLMYWIARKLMKYNVIAKAATKFSPFVYPVYLWQMFFINALWIIWNKMPWTLNNTSAVFYIICSVILTIFGIVMMVKLWRWCSKRVLEIFNTNGTTATP